MNNFHAGWYLIYTKPRHEKKVHTRLNEMQINSFLPLTKKLRTWHDRKKYIDEPLFPSYVFIYLNSLQNYYEGIDAEGSLYYVRTGKEIARIQDSVVNNIKLVAEHAKDPEISETRFQPGHKLVISKGALTGLACEVIESNSKQKLLVRVDLLQRNILITLPAEHLMSL
ncbi:MAG TPA: UpxY family transcription antiterminator [Puia sp.]|nr:UpxY family transcription antiterminator [Puia sp.]